MTEYAPELEAEELEDFIEAYMELDRTVERPVSLFSILPGSREASYQYTLQYFLDPQKPHGFRYTLLKTFFESIEFHEFNLTGQHIEIEEEVGIVDDESGGRIDLVIAGGSSLSDHPRWAVFLELKVGAEEGHGQTRKYAKTDKWRFSWFDSDELIVDRLDDTEYLYVKRDTAPPPSDKTFEPVAWADIVESFEAEIDDAIFDYPNRSVIQFTDFIQSLKQTENMDSSIDEDELNERLTLYFEHRNLIQQVEKANSQFESDFEELSTYLTNSWEGKLTQKYDFQTSGWTTSPSSNAKWQGILPEYWQQDPLNQSSTIKLYFRHAPTTDSLRNRTLSVRLRLPPARNVHNEEHHAGRSFNSVFTEKCTDDYAERLSAAINSIGADEHRLGSASALVTKKYQLDPHNLAESYFQQLDTAVNEFCSSENDLLYTINDVFEETYREVFREGPAGEFPGYLPDRE
ncbi:PD-(D/E)XK nuclease family protein [Salinarchaeum laminariae]|uniref:PD-(D/E)XK nuclease family protein n=1 Tax=Salinarchaeum laminariae TaxID=869888 RepID=UPI0020BF8B97|nr:PD-(D/E)XK nuclease family protein [Salinarchaeum laminariae]